MSEKKGLPWFAWVGIGCAGLIVLGVVAVAGLGLFVGGKVKDLAEDFEERPVYTTAAAIARFNPEIELVDADEDAETVTMRNVKTGEEMTFHLEDIKSGNFSFEKDGERVDVSAGKDGMTVTNDQGTTRFGVGSEKDVPKWVPVPRGAKVNAGYSSNNADSSAGLVQLTDFGDADKVYEFYETELKKAGFEISTQNYSSDGASVRSISARHEGNGRTITVLVNRPASGEEEISLNYSGKN